MNNKFKVLFLGTVLIFVCNIFSMSYTYSPFCAYAASVGLKGGTPPDQVSPPLPLYYCNKEDVNSRHSEAVLLKLQELEKRQKYGYTNWLYSELDMLNQKFENGTLEERIKIHMFLRDNGY
ncbi:MAG TPA: hypothetical protein VHX42_04015 [Candidatus Babeliales bacterium]|nr:hypothetical protein [Candidatus Babeliales bacterium]